VLQIAIFFVSAATLGLELVLMRILSIGHWHHFSYLVISTALLGFGAGGTFITIGSQFFTRHLCKVLWWFALGFALSVPVVFHLSGKVPLDELQLIWDRRQILYLFVYYLLFFIPFFCAGSFIALTFTARTDKAHSLYFYNMTGSGLGIAAIVPLMYAISPQQLLLVISSVAFFAALLLAIGLSIRRLLTTLICMAGYIIIFCPAGLLALDIKISQNKSLVYYSALPGAETLAVRYSPLARLDCIQAPAVRYFPGLSIAYRGRLPQQILLISDADGISAINHFESLGDLACYDHTTSALGYHLLSEPNICIIGSGGGSDVAQALLAGARKVTAVEMNPQIIDLVCNQFGRFSAGIYDRPDVKVVIDEGRSFLQTTPQRFDIINISLLDSFAASTAGVYALNESHLYTIEAVKQVLGRLRPGGLLSITRSLKVPPRDSLKMFATVVEALLRSGIEHPAGHIMMIRSWATATTVASPEPFSAAQLTSARQFAQQRSFDLVHIPGITPSEANRFHVLDEPFYYQSAQQILSAQRESFYRNYTYNIRPATDDKPYFFDFFKWRSLPYMIRTLPGRWLPFSEWGYLVLTAALLQAVFASGFFILLPLFITRPVRSVRSRKSAALVYFLLLGLAYMFLEMGFIQKLTLLIGHPVLAAAVTLLGFLVFSGCGSLSSERLSVPSAGKIRIAVLAIIVAGMLDIAFISFRFEWLIGLSRPARCLAGLALAGPLAFFMGMPFPTALRQLDRFAKPLVPWAWAVNGFASVTAAVLGTFLAVSAGFTSLVFIALGCYLLAAVIAQRLCA
jgi:spermidine synthase